MIIHARHDRDLSNYLCWRSYEADSSRYSDSSVALAKIKLAPARLRQVLGEPDINTHGNNSSGYYLFEDSNLDSYFLYDYRMTTSYWGLNKEDSFYEEQKLKHPKKRFVKYPSVEEFWDG